MNFLNHYHHNSYFLKTQHHRSVEYIGGFPLNHMHLQFDKHDKNLFRHYRNSNERILLLQI